MDFFLEHPMLVTYLFLKIDTIRGWAAGIAFLGILMLSLWKMISIDYCVVTPHFKKSLVALIFLGILTIAAPSAKDVAIMYGVSTGVTVGKEIATSSVTRKSLELFESYVDKSLDEAKNNLEKS